MKEFFDTSVLVAAFWAGHVHHQASVTRLGAASRKESACGIHSLAEVYAVMTALPVKPSIPPDQALLFVEEVRDRLTPVSLASEEYFAAIRSTAERGFYQRPRQSGHFRRQSHPRREDATGATKQ